jgi:DNA-binding Lrp family transcriptional regulator
MFLDRRTRKTANLQGVPQAFCGHAQTDPGLSSGASAHCHCLSRLHRPGLRQTGDSPAKGVCRCHLNLSIKKPCQYFDRSCKTADRQTATFTGFGKAPTDVPSRHLSPIAKLAFYALAAKACGTDRTIWMSDGAIARRCGASRPSVIAGMRQLLAAGLVEKVGLQVNQIQDYRICYPLFGKASGHAPTADLPISSSPVAMAMRSCASCHRPCRPLTRAGICRGCQSDSDLVARVREIRSELAPVPLRNR